MTLRPLLKLLCLREKVTVNTQLYDLLMSDGQMGYSGSWGRTHLAGSGAIRKGFLEEEPPRGPHPVVLKL